MYVKKRQQEIGVSGPLVEKGKDQISLLWQCVGIWVVKEDENPPGNGPSVMDRISRRRKDSGKPQEGDQH